MKDVLDHVKKALIERISSPLLGSFGLAFIVLNWRSVLLVLFGSGTMDERIKLIDSQYASWWLGVAYPILFAVVYVFLFPYISLWISRYSNWIDTRRATMAKQMLERDDLLIEIEDRKARRLREGERREFEYSLMKEQMAHLQKLFMEKKDLTPEWEHRYFRNFERMMERFDHGMY